MRFNLKKTIILLSYYIIPAFLAVGLFLRPDPIFLIYLGRGSLILLGIILFVKPLAAILRINFFWTIVSLRRELGILVFWLFFFHAAGQIYGYGFYHPSVWLQLPVSIYFGFIAGFGLFILALTANNFAIRLLKRNWKKLHYSVYVIFLFALLHRAFITGDFFLSISVFFVFTILKIIEFRKSFGK